METNLNTMELEISLVHEEENHESEMSLAKECRNYFNETKKKFITKETLFFDSKKKMSITDDSSVYMDQNEPFSSSYKSLSKTYFDPKQPIDISEYPELLKMSMQKEAMKKRLILLSLILLSIFILYQIYSLI